MLHTILDCMYEPKVTPKDDEVPSDLDDTVGTRLRHLKKTRVVIPSFDFEDNFSEGESDSVIGMNFAEIPVFC